MTFTGLANRSFLFYVGRNHSPANPVSGCHRFRALVLLFALSNGFHDAANVVAAINMTIAIPPRKNLLIAAACEFIAPFFLGTAVAKVIGKDIVDLSGLGPQTFYTSVVATVIGAIGWNLIT